MRKWWQRLWMQVDVAQQTPRDPVWVDFLAGELRCGDPKRERVAQAALAEMQEAVHRLSLPEQFRDDPVIAPFLNPDWINDPELKKYQYGPDHDAAKYDYLTTFAINDILRGLDELGEWDVHVYQVRPNRPGRVVKLIPIKGTVSMNAAMDYADKCCTIMDTTTGHRHFYIIRERNGTRHVQSDPATNPTPDPGMSYED